MHAPPVAEETDSSGAKRLVSAAELGDLTGEGAAPLDAGKAKKPKLTEAAQARYQQLLARLLVRHRAPLAGRSPYAGTGAGAPKDH